MISKRVWLLLLVSIVLLGYGNVSTGQCWLEGPWIITDSYTMMNVLFSGMIRSEYGKYYLKADYCWLALEEECYVYCYPAGTRVIYMRDGEEPPPPEPSPPEPPQPEPEPQPPDELRIYNVASSSFSFDPYWNDLNPDDIDEITICFDISREAYVNIFIYQNNIYDTTVKRFEELPAGTHCYDWDVTNIDPGRYNVMIRAIDPDDAADFAVDESLKIEILRKAFFDPPDGYVVDTDQPLSFKISEIYQSAMNLFEKVGVEALLFVLEYSGIYMGPMGPAFSEWLENHLLWGDCTITKVKRDLIDWVPGIGYTKVQTWYYKEISYAYGPTYYEPYRVASLSYQSSTILPSKTTSRIVPIDSTVSEATFDLSWQGSDLDLVLYTPDSTRIDPTTAGNDPGIYYVEADTYEYYTVRNPARGDWIMEIIAVDVPPEGEEYIAVAQVSSDLNYDATINITEQFSGSDSDIFDLLYKAIMFSPVGDGVSYMACIRNINELPTDPTGGQAISLSDDGYEYISLAGQRTVSICGSIFAGFYVGSNGYITFSEVDIDGSQSLADHFDTPRVSCLFNDFDPSSSGTVSIKQLNDRVVVTWEQVPQYDIGGSSTFQVEMYFDGTIQLAWLEVSVLDGIVGLSDGQGLRSSFEEVDLSELASTPYVYDIVIGDFENDMDNWGPTWEDSVLLGFSTNPATVTSGSRSLRVQLRPGAYWALQWNAPAVPRLQPGTTLQFDVTMIQSEWTQNNWTQVANNIAINSDGPSGWKEYSPIAIDRITGQSTSPDWGPWNPDALKTYSVDISNYDATGATWFRINISLQQNPVNGAGYFYIDNVQLLGLEP